MRKFIVIFALVLPSLFVTAAEKLQLDAFVDKLQGEKTATSEKHTKWEAMETGPFFTSGLAGEHPACKSISIKLNGTNAAISFDTELLRMTMGWTGGFLKLPTLRAGLEGFPQPIGTTIFSTPTLPGWTKNGHFEDPRPTFQRFDYSMNDKRLVAFPKEIVYGNLPKDWGRWKGLYLHGDKVILNYSVGLANVLELPGFTQTAGLPVFSRDFEIEGASSYPLSLFACGLPEQRTIVFGNGWIAAKSKDTNGTNTFLAVAMVGAPKGAVLDVQDNGIILKLPRSSKRLNFKILITSGDISDFDNLHQVIKNNGDLQELKSLCQGGPGRWGEPLTTQGKLGSGEGEYVVDTITLPENNPWKSWIRSSGFDFFSDGRAAICSVSGDVWIVSGIDDTLNKLSWKRFATGLFQPLGLKIVNDTVYVTCRDELVRLHDLDRDGEADFYENFNNDVAITPHYHEFCLNLETDSKGNFYFCKGSNLREAGIPHHGTLLKVSPDGKKLEVVCNGLRAPNGMSIGPNDEITIADNEGKWTPASRVNLVKKGGFYGNVFTGYTTAPRTNYDNPLLWLPHGNNIDNSSGGQIWVTSSKWGPYKGHLLHTSYGTSSLFDVMTENVEGTWQAGAIKFPLKFETGIMRGRFSPLDGQLYLCGLSVWQSNAAKEGGFQRVRYTGKPVHMPAELHVKPRALELTFACALDSKTAVDAQNFSIEQWNYKWASDYGSKEYSVKEPKEVKHDPVEIKSITLSEDKRKVTIALAEDLKPVMQMKIQYNIDTEDGATLKQEIFNSIFKLPSGKLVKKR